MTLTQFVASRLDEDERAARNARPGYFTPAVLSVFSAAGDAAHVMRHDPARVLREVAAKRAILAEHDDRCCVKDVSGYSVQEWYDPADDPCPTIRALAAIWNDHPDYDLAWSAQQ